MADLGAWPDRLEAAIARSFDSPVDRVAVVAETASTQSAARAMSEGRPGLLLVSGHQTAGRGRLGRRWVDVPGAGVAATWVVDAARYDPGTLSLAAGLAVCFACERALHRARLGLRWPNDVVDPVSGRKLAGTLVEISDGSALVGIGLNVGHEDNAWGPELRDKACSLHQLGATGSRIDILERLVVDFAMMLAHAAPDLADLWDRRNVLAGTTRTFEAAGDRVTGIVEAISPTSDIIVRTPGGTLRRLDALTSTLVP